MENSDFDPCKAYFTAQFTRGGGTRRQDHGTWANTRHNKQRWLDESRFYYNYSDIERFAKRKIVRHGGEMELE